MCQNCGTPLSVKNQVDFLKNYLRTRESEINKRPDDDELKAQIQRTRDLIAHLETGAASQ